MKSQNLEERKQLTKDRRTLFHMTVSQIGVYYRPWDVRLTSGMDAVRVLPEHG